MTNTVIQRENESGKRLVSLELVVATDSDRTVGVMQDIITDAAENRSSYEAETTCSHHDHRRMFYCRHLDNRLTGTRSVFYHHFSADLYSRSRRHDTVH